MPHGINIKYRKNVRHAKGPTEICNDMFPIDLYCIGEAELMVVPYGRRFSMV